jgi:low temperature requirement protein LtrA
MTASPEPRRVTTLELFFDLVFVSHLMRCSGVRRRSSAAK